MTMAWSKPIFLCDLFPGYQEQLHPDQKNPKFQAQSWGVSYPGKMQLLTI